MVAMVSRSGRVRIVLLLAFGVIALCVASFDFWINSHPPFEKRAVDLSGAALLRAGVIALSAAFVVAGVRPGGFLEVRKPLSGFFPYFGGLSAVGIGFIGGSAFLLLFDPEMLTALGGEDGIFEHISAIALLCAALIFVRVGWSVSGHIEILGRSVWARLPYLLIAALFTLIFLEEISWGQRLLGFGTPDIMWRNLQNEVNLHNFITPVSEQAYYLAGLLTFVLLPYASTGILSKLPSWSTPLVPVPAFAIVAAPIAFLQAEMWNSVPMQLAAWGTLLILADFARTASTVMRYWGILIIVVCVGAQIVFLTHSDSLLRRHDLTEYRETLIALLCLIYAGWVFKNVRRHDADGRPAKSVRQSAPLS